MAYNTCVLVPFFNPGRYESRLRNLAKFRAVWQQYTPDVRVIQQKLYDDEPEVGDIVFHGGGVLWQKERLLNLGFQHYCQDYNFIGWCDADTWFWEEDWEPLVLPRLGSVDCFRAFDRYREVLRQPHGGCWFYSQRFWKTCGVFEDCIMGGADTLIMNAILGRRLPLDKVYVSYKSYHRRVQEGKFVVLSADNTLETLPHGAIQDRLYTGRHEVLRRLGFDPAKHLIKRQGALIEWSSHASGLLRDRVERYFYERNEDAALYN